MSELEATSEGNPSEDGSGPEEEEEEEEERGRGVLRCSDTAKKLESAAFNYVSLGQWEAARASFAVLASEPESRENAKELLKILILDSASHWSESAAIPSPHHLSWLALDTYRSLFKEKWDQLPDYVQSLVEFHHLLYLARNLNSFSAHVANWLCRYHAVHVLRIPSASPEPSPHFTPLILSFLRELLFTASPAHGHAMILSLTVGHSLDYHSNDETLQSLYVDCVLDCLESLGRLREQERSVDAESSCDSQYESDCTSGGGKGEGSVVQECRRITCLVYDLLSLADPLPSMTKITKRVDRVFHTLLNTRYKFGDGLTVQFEAGKVFACLLGRSEPFLINRFHDVEEYLRRVRREEEESGKDVVEVGCDFNFLSSPAVWKELYYETLDDNKHLLESVMDKGLQLIYQGNLPELSRLLQRPEQASLRPLLLLVGWDRYAAAGSGQELLDALWPGDVSSTQPLLYRGCCRLAFQVKLVQWCLRKARDHLHQSTLPALTRHTFHSRSAGAGDMFKGLESHSVLYVLHHHTPLASLNPSEVVEILKARPRVPSISAPISPPPQFSRGATPSRASLEFESPLPSPTVGKTGAGLPGTPAKPLPPQTPSFETRLPKLYPEQERDISIVRSFFVLKLVMEAIWASAQLATGICPSSSSLSESGTRGGSVQDAGAGAGRDGAEPQTTQRRQQSRRQISSRAVKQLKLGSPSLEEKNDEEEEVFGADRGQRSEVTDPADRSALLERAYQRRVTEKLVEAKANLSCIVPLNYRLEILENIFSLLFLTSEDIQPLQPREAKEGVSQSVSAGRSSLEGSVSSGLRPSTSQSDGEMSAALSSIALIRNRPGFLMNERIAGDLLVMLQEAIFELRAARYASQANESSAALPPTAVRTSIGPAVVTQRSIKLEQYINEARWRLQLVSSKHGVGNGSFTKARDWDGEVEEDMSDSGGSGSDSPEKEEKREKRKPKRASTSTEPERPDRLDTESLGAAQGSSGAATASRPSSSRPSSVTSKDKLSPSLSTQSSLSTLPRTASTLPTFSTKSSRVSPQLMRTVTGRPKPKEPVAGGHTLLSATPEAEEDSGDCADIDETVKSPDRSQRKRRLRSRSSQATLVKKRRRRSDRAGEGGIVRMMLASPGSLLRMCLRHANYLRALEVLRMFKMEGHFGEAFVKFTEQLESVSRELSERSHSTTPGQSPGRSLGEGSPASSTGGGRGGGGGGGGGKAVYVAGRESKAPTLPMSGPALSLQVAIKTAATSSIPLESLHRLLSPTSINHMLFSGDEHLECRADDSPVLQTLVKHVPVLVMLDVVCGGRIDGVVAKRIIEQAVERCPNGLKALVSLSGGDAIKRVSSSDQRWSTLLEGLLSGPFALLLTLSEVSDLFVPPDAPSSGPAPSHTSPHALLTSFTRPLRLPDIRNAKLFSESYRLARGRLEEHARQAGTADGDTITRVLQLEGESSFPAKQRNPFDELVRALSSASHSPPLSPAAQDRRLLRRHSSSSSAVFLDEPEPSVRFVRQFSRYLSRLVELLLKCLGRAGSGSPDCSFLLSVLPESPSHMLGRLVFEQSIKPHHLEGLMGEFPHLQIVEVLVKCCCPHVPSSAVLPVVTRMPRPPRPAVVALNECGVGGGAAGINTCGLACDLLSKLITLLKGSAPTFGGPDTFLGPRDLQLAYKSPEMKELLSRAPLLARVDLTQLDSAPKLTSFLCNVASFLYAHASMAYLASMQGGEPMPDVVNSSVSLATMMGSRVAQEAYFSRVGYRIGQLGLVSCHDLHYSILLRGLQPPRLNKASNLKPRIAPCKSDPWFIFAPSSTDARIIYAVHDGRFSSPPPMVLTPEDLPEALAAAESSYLTSTVAVDLSAREVTLPQRILNHADDLAKPIWSDNATEYGNLPTLALLKYLVGRLAPETASLLQPLIDASESSRSKKLTIKMTPANESIVFGYNFGLKRSRGAGAGGDAGEGCTSESPNGSPRTGRRRFSRDDGRRELHMDLLPAMVTPSLAGVEKTCREQPRARYAITIETLAFVKQRSPLLAALVHLLCSPPSPLTSGKSVGRGRLEEAEEEEAGEEEVERERKEKRGEKGKEREGDEGGKPARKNLFKSLRGDRPAAAPPPLLKKRSLSSSGLLPLQPWRRQFEDVLIHFIDFPVLRNYLLTRLMSFEHVLPWESSQPADAHSQEVKGHLHSNVPGLPNLRELALLPTSSARLGEVCCYVMRKLLDTGLVTEAVNFLSSEPVLAHGDGVSFMADFALASAFVKSYLNALSVGRGGESVKETTASMDPISLLSRLSDPELASRLVLSSLHNWPVQVCSAMLSHCLHHLPSPSPLLPLLTEKLARMRVYEKVMKTCENQNPLHMATTSARKRGEWRAGTSAGVRESPWEKWSQLAADSENRPDYVLRVLLESKAFSLARFWAASHGLDQDVTQQIEVDYLFVLLEGEHPDPVAAQQVLDGLLDDQLTMKVCLVVLDECEQLQTVVFVLHYMLTRLAHCIHAGRTKDYCNRLLGAKALLCLPQFIRRDYERLISEPVLLVEQLLMDMKIDWAGLVIQKLRSDEYIGSIHTVDTPLLDHTPLLSDEAKDPFTSFLMFYSARSVEFPQPILTDTPQTQDLSSSMTSTRPSTPPTRHIRSQTSPTDHAYSTGHRPLRKRLSSALFSPIHGPHAAHLVPTPFEPPPYPPPRDRWESNDEARRCRVCRQVYFGMFSRRHHCRRCGRVVCARCSSNVGSVEGYDRPVRVCNDCFSFCITESDTALDDAEAPPTGAGYSTLGSMYPPVHTSPTHYWRILPSDPLFNQNVRREFYYEQTPSAALCLALVDLMKNQTMAASYLLDCCHTVSAQLVPDSHGRINREIDHYFVIGLIQNLLLNAKLRFAESGDSSGVELCDTYLSKVDLLRLLVSSRWHHIPSIQELTKPDLARRVRDRLIEDDRFRLAMEVSTKCQLDAGAVWSAWGMACLKCGDFLGAKDRFRHCFQMSSLGAGSQNIALLNRIVDQIEQNPLAVTATNTQHAGDWTNVMVGLSVLMEKRSEDCDLDIHRFNECVYYIRSYGNVATLISFFVRHNCWTDACKYILDHQCPKEVFVDSLWVPALKSGKLEHVQDCLKVLDPTLGIWEPYLTSVCRYFTQRSLYSILYNTQLFMKDYVRAGMTCIKFYIGFSGRATTIADLFSRRHYLHTARRHFENSFDTKQRPGERRQGRGRGLEEAQRGAALSRKSMSLTELQSHLKTIELQISVTDFLFQSAVAQDTAATPLPLATGIDTSGRHTPQPATLFSNAHVRAEVVMQLLTRSQDIIEGFQLATEIIQVYRLPLSSVLCDTAKELAQKQNYGDIRLLLQCIQKSRFDSNSLRDDIIMASIKVIAATKETKIVDKLVDQLTSERSKIKALIQCGKLKNAYLTAIKSHLDPARVVTEVKNISEIAEKASQLAVRDICEKWLQVNAHPHR